MEEGAKGEEEVEVEEEGEEGRRGEEIICLNRFLLISSVCEALNTVLSRGGGGKKNGGSELFFFFSPAEVYCILPSP